MSDQQPRAVEDLQASLNELLREREELRGAGADRAALEHNRLAIVRAQWDLSRALIARYGASFQAA